jgi:hypothetical protein
MEPDAETRSVKLARWGFASGAFALVALAIAYWLVVPSLLFGAIGVALGVAARRNESLAGRSRDMAMAAICLGVVAVLFTPVALWQSNQAEQWGRDCALDPDQDPNCPEIDRPHE